MSYICLLLLISFISGAQPQALNPNEAMDTAHGMKLIRHLLDNYDRSVRPVKNKNKPVNILIIVS